MNRRQGDIAGQGQMRGAQRKFLGVSLGLRRFDRAARATEQIGHIADGQLWRVEIEGLGRTRQNL